MLYCVGSYCYYYVWWLLTTTKRKRGRVKKIIFLYKREEKLATKQQTRNKKNGQTAYEEKARFRTISTPSNNEQSGNGESEFVSAK